MLQLERIQENRFQFMNIVNPKACRCGWLPINNCSLLGNPEYQPTKEDNHRQSDERQYLNYAQ